MLLLPKSLQVIKAASNDQTRPALRGVRIEADGSTVATNGHILARFQPTEHPDAKEYPTVEGCCAVSDEPLAPFTLPSEAIAMILKAVPKTRRTLPILGTIALDVLQTNQNGCAVLATTDLENPQIFRPRKIEDDFPDFSKVMPAGKPKMIVGFKVETFRDALDTLRATGVEFFVLELRDETGPAKIVGQTKDRDGIVTALVMPARVDHPSPWQDPTIPPQDKPEDWDAKNAEIDEAEEQAKGEPIG